MHSLMIEQVQSLPELLRTSLEPIDRAIREGFDNRLCNDVSRLYVIGCGDSHHAALCSELAIEAFSGIPVEAMTALQFSRYSSAHLPSKKNGVNAVIGISVSGSVARTAEALAMGREKGAQTIALTAAPESRIALESERTLISTIPDLDGHAGVPVPGIRSFFTNLLALTLIGIRLGEERGNISPSQADVTRRQLLDLAGAIGTTVENCAGPAMQLVKNWADANEFVYTGGGPNYGTALFSAAKLLEASGDTALGQDTEEWAHLQYFARQVETPTIIITAGERDYSRAVEIATAAKTIGRRVAVVAPRNCTDILEIADIHLPVARVPELFSPLITAVAGELIAAYRAEERGEFYFRGFGGGRSVEGGGGISRIRTSQVWEHHQNWD